LQVLRFATVGDGAADVVLSGALSEAERWTTPGEFPAGDRNVLQVEMTGVQGSGPRRNVFGAVLGPAQPSNFGTGNQVMFVGSAAEFRRGNPGVDPGPGAETFVGPRP
jgi:hypothetical protein